MIDFTTKNQLQNTSNMLNPKSIELTAEIRFEAVKEAIGLVIDGKATIGKIYSSFLNGMEVHKEQNRKVRNHAYQSLVKAYGQGRADEAVKATGLSPQDFKSQSKALHDSDIENLKNIAAGNLSSDNTKALESFIQGRGKNSLTGEIGELLTVLSNRKQGSFSELIEMKALMLTKNEAKSLQEKWPNNENVALTKNEQSILKTWRMEDTRSPELQNRLRNITESNVKRIEELGQKIVLTPEMLTVFAYEACREFYAEKQAQFTHDYPYLAAYSNSDNLDKQYLSFKEAYLTLWNNIERGKLSNDRQTDNRDLSSRLLEDLQPKFNATFQQAAMDLLDGLQEIDIFRNELAAEGKQDEITPTLLKTKIEGFLNKNKALFAQVKDIDFKEKLLSLPVTDPGRKLLECLVCEVQNQELYFFNQIDSYALSDKYELPASNLLVEYDGKDLFDTPTKNTNLEADYWADNVRYFGNSF